MERQMKLGVALPIVDIGGEPDTIRDFVQAAEEIGYQGIALPDHVLGANPESRPGWTQQRGRSTDLYHDPFVLFGFLAAVTKIEDFSTQVLILPQRQTALVAKQAACLDVLSGGRFRLGIGVGWMPLAYGPGEEARAAFDRLHHMAEEAARDPATIGIDTRVSAAGEEAEWRDTVRFWKSCGVTHLTLANYYQSGHLRRIEGRSLSDHIGAMQHYWAAVADLL